jgi:uncharacterized protein (TIGR03437 family)
MNAFSNPIKPLAARGLSSLFRSLLPVCLLAAFALSAHAANFGTVVVLRGMPNDLALDESRGLLYVANFSSSRIDVVDTVKGVWKSSITVAPQPASIAISPTSQYLVAVHYGPWTSGTPKNGITIVNLATNAKQSLSTGESAPLAVSFGADGLALLISSTHFFLLDPATGSLKELTSIAAVGATLPAQAPSFPAEIVQASSTSSADGQWITGLASAVVSSNDASSDESFLFRYRVSSRSLSVRQLTASPALGPRVVSSSSNGSVYIAGWGMFDTRGTLMAEATQSSGQYEEGTHAIDDRRGYVYALFRPRRDSSNSTSGSGSGSGSTDPATSCTTGEALTMDPQLLVMDGLSLAVLERLRLPEMLRGKSVLSSDGATMYSVSDSGVMILPVGDLDRLPRVQPSRESLLFRHEFCTRSTSIQEIDIVNPGGGTADFSLSASGPGVFFDQVSGVTPARIRVAVDPTVYQNDNGTSTVTVTINSSAAVNVPPSFRILINNRNPDQRGTIFNVPGRLVDILADPARDRFYILRQDKNQVLVFDGSSFAQIASFRTGNVPTQMAITQDRKYLLVGNNDSGIANVINLEKLQPEMPVAFPIGHYPRSIAASGRAILAACRVAGPDQTIDRIDLPARLARQLPSIGVWENKISEDTMLSVSPSGNSVFGVMANGITLLYDATSDEFVVMRQDSEELQGGYGALTDDQFAVGDQLLNGSLVPSQAFPANGTPTGYGALGGYAYRSTAVSASHPGHLMRFLPGQATPIRPVRLAEAPVLPGCQSVFIRTVAVLPATQNVVVLTTSGFTVLSPDYDAAVQDPRINAVVNAADFSSGIAPGGLVSVFGEHLSPVTVANAEMPVPTALAGTCLTVNGTPIPVFYVSPSQLNAQLPFYTTGTAQMTLRTPGGASNVHQLTVQSAAPSVFRSGTAGPVTGIPTVLRATNGQLVTLSNPVHIDDRLIIYATGMGDTNVDVKPGQGAPSSPLARVLIPPQVTLGGQQLDVEYAGLAPGLAGVYQINVRVPMGTPLGMSIPLTILQGGQSTTLQLRVIK